MQNQKFYLIFIIVLLFIGVYSFKLTDNNIFPNKFEKQGGDDFLSEASMIYNEDINSDEKNRSRERSYNGDKDESSALAGSTSDRQKITVNPPTALSGKTKSEVYNIRKSYVKQSIFSSANYEPSEKVFGGIVSGKPWISANVCIDPQIGKLRTTGPSEEARFINNPTMLVAIEYPFPVRYNSEICTSQYSELIPTSITYSPTEKIITVKYYHLPFTTNNNPSFYNFNGVNARDFGYKFAYIDNEKSTYKVDFMNSDNLSTGVHEFQNFIHLGGSCGHEGGCNNGSPRQPFLEFKSNATSYSYENKYIYIKLWKSMPKSPKDPADITEKIILRWS